MKFLISLIVLSTFSLSISAQSNNSQLPTSIRTDGQAPDPSAILDVDSNTKGVLIPRVTNTQMTMISAPATGLLIYNTTANAFYFYDGSSWTNLSGTGGSGGSSDEIVDADLDTKVEVDDGADHDQIKFKVADGSGGSIEAFSIEHNSTLKNSRLSSDGYDNNLFIGKNAGLSNDADAGTNTGSNSFIGINSGEKNTTGYKNTFLGSYSGNNNTTGIRNIFLGSYAGYSNNIGSYNIFLGEESGFFNATGNNNVFLGRLSGAFTNTGNRNFFSGTGAGYSNTTGDNNIFSGYQAGYSNTTGNANIFIGYSAGYAETRSDKLYIENTNSASPLIYGEFDNDFAYQWSAGDR